MAPVSILALQLSKQAGAHRTRVARIGGEEQKPSQPGREGGELSEGGDNTEGEKGLEKSGQQARRGKRWCGGWGRAQMWGSGGGGGRWRGVGEMGFARKGGGGMSRGGRGGKRGTVDGTLGDLNLPRWQCGMVDNEGVVEALGDD